MALAAHIAPFGGVFARRFTRYAGLYFDEFASDSAWVRELAVIRLPPMPGVAAIVVRGEFKEHPDARGVEKGFPSLEALVDDKPCGTVSATAPGSWEITCAVDAKAAEVGPLLKLKLGGVSQTNALAWLGRVTGLGPFQRFRGQRKNRQLRITSIESNSGERIYDFSKRESPFCIAFTRAHLRTGMNVVGFLTADLGIGESARCMVRAGDAAGIPMAVVPLKLNCRNRLGDLTYAARLQDANPQGVNVFHIDPPVARDIEHHHGEAFCQDKFNIGYFAWELPEFPDAWMSAFDYFDEVWCPSDFVRESMALKAPFPVITMPHSVGFERPKGDRAALRSRFRLPPEPFLFLALFDLNSYTARKNPRAAIEAFRLSGLEGKGACLVIKVQNAESNAADFAALKEAVRDLPGTVIISETLSRADVYALEAACDCFVSLHRSEGFGFAVAECMYLGKPTISTDWSATAEYLNRENGYPVRCSLVRLTENHGPYSKGSTWAEPDIAHAAELMRRVTSDTIEAARIGALARQTIENRFSPSIIGARYKRRLETIASL